MTFEKNSLILVDYTARIKDDDEVFETTIEEDAKKYHIYKSNVAYQPKLVSIGDLSFPIIAGVDEALAQSSVDEKLTVELEPAKAFGERDSSHVKMIPIRKLGKDADKLTVGDTIELDEKPGVIRFIGSGRVQVDCNHKYAGKTTVYDIHVKSFLESPNDKIDGILKNAFPINDPILFDLRDDKLEITIPEKIFRAESLQITKFFAQQNIFKFIPTISEIKFVETYLKPKDDSVDDSADDTETLDDSTNDSADDTETLDDSTNDSIDDSTKTD